MKLRGGGKASTSLHPRVLSPQKAINDSVFPVHYAGLLNDNVRVEKGMCSHRIVQITQYDESERALKTNSTGAALRAALNVTETRKN